MENEETIVIFNNGEVKLNLGNLHKPQVKRSIFGKERLEIHSVCYGDDESYGPFDPEKIISIDSVAHKADGIIVISKSDNEGKLVLTHYYNSGKRGNCYKESYEADNITKCEDPYLYLLEENGKTRIYVPYDRLLLSTYFERVDTDNSEIKDKGSVIVERIVRSKVNPEVYDRITYGFNPFGRNITTNIYSELQNRTICMEKAAEALGKKLNRFAYVISDSAIVEEEIKRYLDLVAFYTQREELTHEEVMKKIGTRR